VVSLDKQDVIYLVDDVFMTVGEFVCNIWLYRDSVDVAFSMFHKLLDYVYIMRRMHDLSSIHVLIWIYILTSANIVIAVMLLK